MQWLGILVVLAGCGRLGFDEGSPAGSDARLLAGCPDDMAPTRDGSGVCIERLQRGSRSWRDANADCADLGRRLCSDAEWTEACVEEPSLVAMLDDWEWVSEASDGIAQKRGGDGTCAGMSTHEIEVDPFGYRCCLDLAQ